MTALLRLIESGLSIQQGETLALIGAAADLPRALAGLAPLDRHVAAFGIIDLVRVPAASRGFAYVGAADGLVARKTVAANVAAAVDEAGLRDLIEGFGQTITMATV